MWSISLEFFFLHNRNDDGATQTTRFHKAKAETFPIFDESLSSSSLSPPIPDAVAVLILSAQQQTCVSAVFRPPPTSRPCSARWQPLVMRCPSDHYYCSGCDCCSGGSGAVSWACLRWSVAGPTPPTRTLHSNSSEYLRPSVGHKRFGQSVSHSVNQNQLVSIYLSGLQR